MGLPTLHGRRTRGTQSVRLGRFSNPGQVYFVTTVVAGRLPVFAQWPIAAAAARIANGAFGDSRFITWILMPDHFHGLLQMGDVTTLSQAVRLLKGRVANSANQLLGRTGALWQHGFHDHAIREEEDLRGVARYIVLNPVRAGLVRRVADYPFWNADWV